MYARETPDFNVREAFEEMPNDVNRVYEEILNGEPVRNVVCTTENPSMMKSVELIDGTNGMTNRDVEKRPYDDLPRIQFSEIDVRRGVNTIQQCTSTVQSNAINTGGNVNRMNENSTNSTPGQYSVQRTDLMNEFQMNENTREQLDENIDTMDCWKDELRMYLNWYGYKKYDNEENYYIQYRSGILVPFKRDILEMFKSGYNTGIPGVSMIMNNPGENYFEQRQNETQEQFWNYQNAISQGQLVQNQEMQVDQNGMNLNVMNYTVNPSNASNGTIRNPLNENPFNRNLSNGIITNGIVTNETINNGNTTINGVNSTSFHIISCVQTYRLS